MDGEDNDANTVETMIMIMMMMMKKTEFIFMLMMAVVMGGICAKEQVCFQDFMLNISPVCYRVLSTIKLENFRSLPLTIF